MNKQIQYECTGCGACCRWEGYVRITEEEADAIANFLNVDTRSFVDRYTVLTRDRQGLSLREHEDGACIFLTADNRCQINPVKPQQCRDFPNKWNFPGFEKICQAKIVLKPFSGGDSK